MRSIASQRCRELGRSIRSRLKGVEREHAERRRGTERVPRRPTAQKDLGLLSVMISKKNNHAPCLSSASKMLFLWRSKQSKHLSALEHDEGQDQDAKSA